MTSPTRGPSQGTVDRGNLGSSSYSGTITFSDNDAEYQYVFYLETGSFHWTKVGDGHTTYWKNGVSVSYCPVLPSKSNQMIFDFYCYFQFMSCKTLLLQQ